MMMWYRGRILAKNTMSRLYEVFMCDYGYKVEARESDLRTIPKDLTKFEDCVSFCSLDVLYVASIESGAAIQLLHNLIGNYKQMAVSYSDYTAAVTLWGSTFFGRIEWDSDWDDLNLKFMSRSIERSMQHYIDKTQHQYRTTIFNTAYAGEEHFNEFQMLMKFLESDDDSTLQNEAASSLLSNITLAKNIDRWNLPNQLDRAELFGIVTYIHHTGTIFVQVGRDHKTAKDLEVSITKYISTERSCDEKHVWKKNNTCFTKPIHNKYFRRAIIKTINQERGICQIIFVDYGNKMIMKLNDLHVARSFNEIPMLAQRFYVPEIIVYNRNKHWSDYVLEKSRDRLMNQTCKINIKGDLKRRQKITTWIKVNKLHYEEKIDQQGNVILFV